MVSARIEKFSIDSNKSDKNIIVFKLSVNRKNCNFVS